MDTIKKKCDICDCDFDGLYDEKKICEDCEEKIEIFDNYKFGIDTKINIYANNIDYNVLSVDYEKREVDIGIGIVGLDGIKNIKE